MDRSGVPPTPGRTVRLFFEAADTAIYDLLKTGIKQGCTTEETLTWLDGLHVAPKRAISCVEKMKKILSFAVHALCDRAAGRIIGILSVFAERQIVRRARCWIT